MEVLITLTTAGADTGPFDLYSDADSFTIPFETSVAKIDLQGGFTSTNAPSGTTIVRVQSTSIFCTNFIDINLIPETSSTTTSTTTCPTYYELAGCDPGDYAFTTITPTLGIGQQYVLPLPEPEFYTYTGSSIITCVIPGPYNASIQATANTGCP